ncbi:MAG TPA: MMPL family transporter, partial [Nocardioides sp.]|nr:MMPL family transporter [Nocardioides sp.]
TAVVPPGEAAKVTAGMKNLDAVRLAIPVPAGDGFESAAVLLVMAGDPYSGEAAEEVERIRERLHAISPDALLGGLPAENWDVERTNARDTRLIVPLVLVIVGLILAAVLQAVAAPLYLIATVVLSFASTLGLSTFLFSQFGGEGITFDLTLLAFLFLVALGVDYNIFLMTRVREETINHGTRKGSLIALSSTGGVITAAGLVLAATFAILATMPMTFTLELGTTIALGVLLDTWIVRSVLVTAINLDAGDRIWWPSKLATRGGEPDANPAGEPVTVGS